MHNLQKASCQINTLLKTVALNLLALCIAAPAHAGPFTITPVRIYMTPKDKAVAMTITNEGDDELVMQADIYSWKQTPEGKDDLVLTEDMLLSPPIIKLAGKSRQVVRLAKLRPLPQTEQLTYRMIVREIPEAKPAKDNVQIQIAIAFSLPIFITPPGAKNKLDCTVERTAANSINAICENTGNAYAHPLDFELTGPNGDKLASRDSGSYILPGIKHIYEIKRADGRIPGGKARLAVTHDNGVKQTYEVVLTD